MKTIIKNSQIENILNSKNEIIAIKHNDTIYKPEDNFFRILNEINVDLKATYKNKTINIANKYKSRYILNDKNEIVAIKYKNKKT
jgi:hypothetical protein